MARLYMFALWLALAATLLFHERVSAAVEDTHQWWLQRQAQWDEAIAGGDAAATW